MFYEAENEEILELLRQVRRAAAVEDAACETETDDAIPKTCLKRAPDTLTTTPSERAMMPRSTTDAPEHIFGAAGVAEETMRQHHRGMWMTSPLSTGTTPATGLQRASPYTSSTMNSCSQSVMNSIFSDPYNAGSGSHCIGVHGSLSATPTSISEKGQALVEKNSVYANTITSCYTTTQGAELQGTSTYHQTVTPQQQHLYRCLTTEFAAITPARRGLYTLSQSKPATQVSPDTATPLMTATATGAGLLYGDPSVMTPPQPQPRDDPFSFAEISHPGVVSPRQVVHGSTPRAAGEPLHQRNHYGTRVVAATGPGTTSAAEEPINVTSAVAYSTTSTSELKTALHDHRSVNTTASRELQPQPMMMRSPHLSVGVNGYPLPSTRPDSGATSTTQVGGINTNMPSQRARVPLFGSLTRTSISYTARPRGVGSERLDIFALPSPPRPGPHDDPHPKGPRNGEDPPQHMTAGDATVTGAGGRPDDVPMLATGLRQPHRIASAALPIGGSHKSRSKPDPATRGGGALLEKEMLTGGGRGGVFLRGAPEHPSPEPSCRSSTPTGVGSATHPSHKAAILLSSIASFKDNHSNSSGHGGLLARLQQQVLSPSADLHHPLPLNNDRATYDSLGRCGPQHTQSVSPMTVASCTTPPGLPRRPHTTMTSMAGAPDSGGNRRLLSHLKHRHSPPIGGPYHSTSGRQPHTPSPLGPPAHGAGGGSTASRHSPSLSPLVAMLYAPPSEGSTLEDVQASMAHKILSMCRDQLGCRQLQDVLDREAKAIYQQFCDHHNAHLGNPLVAQAFRTSLPIQRIVEALLPHMAQVISDSYGNFLFQKLFEVAPDAERVRYLTDSSLSRDLGEVACSPHGTFAVQRLIETLRNDAEERLVFDSLNRHLMLLLTDANGGHVLLKTMAYVRSRYLSQQRPPPTAATAAELTAITPKQAAMALIREKVAFLYNGLVQNLLTVCQHRQGCCVVQKCIDFFALVFPLPHPPAPGTPPTLGNDEDNCFAGIVQHLLRHVVPLATDPYGNYVITHVVEVCYAKGSIHLVDALASVMQGEVVRLCKDKFASNVVEHVLRYCNDRRIRYLCRALMKPASRSGSRSSAETPLLPLVDIALDPYGNYVVQTLLTVAPVTELLSNVADVQPSASEDPAEGSASNGEEGGMLPVLQRYLPVFRERNFGKKLETKLELALLRVAQHQEQRQAEVAGLEGVSRPRDELA